MSVQQQSGHEKVQRNAPYHAELTPGKAGALVFVTVRTTANQRVLATPELHAIVKRLWGDQPQWLVGRYVILPDHIHLFASPASLTAIPLKRWIGWWKGQSSMAMGMGKSLWHQNFWDTRMRSEEHYAAKLWYVQENPVRHGLVRRSEEWEFSGVIHSLRW